MGINDEPSRSFHAQFSTGIRDSRKKAVSLVDLRNVERRVLFSFVQVHETAADPGLRDVNGTRPQHIHRRLAFGNRAELDVQAFSVKKSSCHCHIDWRVEEVPKCVHQAQWSVLG